MELRVLPPAFFFADIPVAMIVRGWEEAYGADRVKSWIEALEQSAENLRASSNNEKPLQI